MTLQYLRKVDLVVSTGEQGINLSQFKIKFRTFAPLANAPPILYARVYNLKEETANQIQNQYEKVTLQAGYESGEVGIIFQGTIIQVKKGSESAINSYVDIVSADLDLMMRFTTVNKTLSAGASPQDQYDAVIAAAKEQGAEKGTTPENFGTGGVLPRGKVLFGMATDLLDNISDSTDTQWQITNGKVNVISQKGYLPDEAVVINARTGMVGVPEATNEGVEVSCLLNPKIKVGTRVKLDNKSITTTQVRQFGGAPTYSSFNFPASVDKDGIYKVLVVEHEGDTRANEFYTKIVCLSVDPSALPGNSVKAFG